MIYQSAQKLDPREQHFWIDSPRQGMQLFLRHLPPLTRQAGQAAADSLRPRRDLSLSALDRAPVRWLFVARCSVRGRLRCLGLRLSRLWIFGPVCRDERAAASESAALPRSRSKRATRGGHPLHTRLAWSIQPIDHQPFVGFNASQPVRRAPPDNGGPNGVIRRHRSPSAT